MNFNIINNNDKIGENIDVLSNLNNSGNENQKIININDEKDITENQDITNKNIDNTLNEKENENNNIILNNLKDPIQYK